MVDNGMSVQFVYAHEFRAALQDEAQRVKKEILNQAVGESTCFIMCWNKHSASDAQQVMTEMFNRAARFFKTPEDSVMFVRDVINANNDAGGIGFSDASAAMERLNDQLMTISLVGGAIASGLVPR